MVFIDTKATHCPTVMVALNKQRLDNTFCEVHIIVGDQTLPAHKNVLIAGSDYFKAHFGGHFKDGNSNIDISFVTLDSASVEQVLNFLYTGQVEINKENVESLLKISSFLLISKVREHCVEFIESTIGQDTVLSYYFLATDHMIVDLEKKLKMTVHTRFHDWLIYNPGSLHISPQQLSILIENCEIFEFCSDVALLEYITEWCVTGRTTAHDTLTCDVLEFLCKKNEGNANKTGEELQSLERLRATLESLFSYSKVCHKVQKVVGKYFRKLFPEKMVYELRSVKSAVEDSVSDLKIIKTNESALVAIVPNQHLKTFAKNLKETHINIDKIADKEPVFNIFIYIPRVREWYYFSEGLYRDTFKDIVDEEYRFTFFGMRDAFCCVDPNYDANSLHVVYLNKIKRDDAFRFVDYSDVIEGFETEETFLLERYCIISDHDTVYLILGEYLEDDESLQLRCYRLKENNTWQFIFCTPKSFDAKFYGDISGRASSKGNELLLLYSRGSNAPFLIYVAQLSEQRSSAKVIQLQADIPVSWYWTILRDTDRFYLVEIDGLKFACKYTYGYNSGVLCRNNGTGVELSYSSNAEENDPLVNCHVSTRDENSEWVFTGLDHYGSSLKEISVTKDGNLQAIDHVPPPFRCATGFCACEISPECLSKAKLMKKFDPFL